MRRALVAAWTVVAAACGPSVSGDDTQTTDATTSGEVAGSTSDPGASGGLDDGTTIPPATSVATDPTTGGDTSTGAPEFSDDQLLGGWVCQGDGPAFYMQIDAYLSPYDIVGLVCIDGEGTPNPASWQPCGELTVHPIGVGGPFLWIYVLVAGMPDTISVALLYDPATDTFEGMWSGPGVEDLEGTPTTCTRVGG